MKEPKTKGKPASKKRRYVLYGIFAGVSLILYLLGWVI